MVTSAATKTKAKSKSAETENSHPIYKARLGAMKIALWQNEHQNDEGETMIFDSIKLERSWMDKDGNWQDTEINLRGKDVGNAIALLQSLQQNQVSVG